MLNLLKSAYLHRLFRMGESDYLLSSFPYFYLCYLSDYRHDFMFIGDICPIFPGRFCLFIFMLHITLHFFHFSFLLLNNASFHRLFRMGESDYLCDNLECRSLSQTKRKISLFFLFILVKKEYAACIFFTLFRIRF
jgi:hypothetical protein